MSRSLPPRGNSGPQSADDPRRAILQAVDVVVPELPVPQGYGVYLGFLAAVLMLMPLLYLALICFLGWLAVWHTWQAFASMQYGPFFIFHLPMAALGGLLLLFLVKPVFMRQREDESRIIVLREDNEPLLFEFVRRLCQATSAPMPVRIEVDCEANASAGLDRGLRSLGDGKLVLRIGLPLVAAMPVRHLAGILAHEFGHFTQRSGMTGSYLVRRLNRFFARVVFERDRLDEWLHRMRASSSAGGKICFYVSAGLVEAARGVLWLMLIVAELLTCSVLRRMEYDADQREAHVSGARDFERTSQVIVLLDIAGHQARYQLTRTWDQRRLADDLPRLIHANARQLLKERPDILKLMGEGVTQWFDTHPSHSDRIQNVKQLGAPGLVQCDLPASRLFTDFGAVCRKASDALYRSVFGKALSEAKLVPTAVMLGELDGRRDAYKALNRYLQGCITVLRPMFPGDDADLKADDPRGGARELVACRKAMLAAAEPAGDVIEPFEKASATIAVARSEMALCRIFAHSPQARKLKAHAERELARQQSIHKMAEEKLQAFEMAARQRLTMGLQLLWTDALAARLSEAGSGRTQAVRMLEVCKALEPCVSRVRRLQEMALTIQLFCAAHDQTQPQKELVDRILDTAREIGVMLHELKEELAAVPYPFEHATAGISVGAAIVQRMPERENPVDACTCAMDVVELFTNLAQRTVAVLAEWAEKVELAIGLQRLPEPKDKNSSEAEQQALADKRDERHYWILYGARAAAGFAMLAVLVWFSVDPPVLSGIRWGSGSGDGRGYRPAAFQVPMRQRNEPSVPMIYPPGYRQWQQQPGFPRPTHPMMPQPAQPRNPRQPYTPGQANPSVPSPAQPYPSRPIPQQPVIPQPARPQPAQPGYRPNQPGQSPGQPGYIRPQPQPQPMPQPPVPQPRRPMPSPTPPAPIHPTPPPPPGRR